MDSAHRRLSVRVFSKARMAYLPLMVKPLRAGAKEKGMTGKYFSTRLGQLLLIAAFLFMIVDGHCVAAQTGENAVYTSSGSCCSPSTAYIDAGAFCATPGACTTSDDFCVVANKALHNLPSAGGTVDARGINPAGTNKCGTLSSPTTPYTFSLVPNK